MADLPQSPWSCSGCGSWQELVDSPRGPRYSGSDWRRVRLRPGAEPVMLDLGCFEAYAHDWPLNGGGESMATTWEFEDGLWVLRTDYWDRLGDAECQTCHHPAVEHRPYMRNLLRCDHCRCAVISPCGARLQFLIHEGAKTL